MEYKRRLFDDLNHAPRTSNQCEGSNNSNYVARSVNIVALESVY